MPDHGTVVAEIVEEPITIQTWTSRIWDAIIDDVVRVRGEQDGEIPCPAAQRGEATASDRIARPATTCRGCAVSSGTSISAGCRRPGACCGSSSSFGLWSVRPWRS